MRELKNAFLPWTKAFEAAGVENMPRTARGFWGHAQGAGGHVVCSVWDNQIQMGRARAHIPKDNRGGYKEAASELEIGDLVIVLLRSRSTDRGKVMPTLWKVASKNFDQPRENSIGYLVLENTGEDFPG